MTQSNHHQPHITRPTRHRITRTPITNTLLLLFLVVGFVLWCERVKADPSLEVSFVPSTTYVNDTSGKPKLSVKVNNWLMPLTAAFEYQIYYQDDYAKIPMTDKIKTPSLNVIPFTTRFEIVLPVFTAVANYTARVDVKTLNSFPVANTINPWSVNKMIIQSYNEFTSFDTLSKLSLTDLEQASTNSLLYALSSHKQKLLDSLTMALCAMNPNTSTLHDTKSLVNSFKSVSSFKEELSQMSVGGITDSISDYSKIMVSLSKNQSSNSEVQSISNMVDTVKDVLGIISNCMTALRSYTNNKYSSVIENMISVTALTANTTDSHILNNEAFEVVILPDLTNQTSNPFLTLNGSIIIFTPNSLISETAKSGKKLSLGSVKYLYSSKIVPSQTVQLEFNSTTTTIITDTLQDLSNTIQIISQNITLNSTLTNNSSMPLIRVSIAPIISVEYLQNGLITALTDLPQPIQILFPTLNTSMISRIEQFTKSSNLKYNFICMYWNETVNAWKSNGCVTLQLSTYYIRCECDHTTKFTSFIEFSQDTRSTFSSDPQLIAQIIISSIFIICILIILVGLVIMSNVKAFTKQPIKSRWIFPYLSLIALLIENAFSNIVSESITLSINNGASISYDAVNIFRDVSALVVVTLISLAIWNFVLNHIRYILFRYMYEIMSMLNERQLSLKQLSPIVKFISNKKFMILSNCVISLCVIGYFVIFVSLARTSVITSTTFSWIMSVSFFVFVMVMTTCLIGIYLFDIYMEVKYKQISNEMKNVGKFIMSSDHGNNNKTQQQSGSSKLEHFVQGVTKSFPKTGAKGVQVNWKFYSNSSFLRRMQHFFLTNDRLFFRLEAVIFFVSIALFIIAYGLGFSVLAETNSTTSTDTSTSSSPFTNDNLTLKLAFNLVFQTLFEAGFIIAFGGLVFIGSFIKNSKNLSARNKSSTTDSVVESEQDAVTKLLKNPSTKKVFEQFCKLEFSLENVIMWTKVENFRELLKSTDSSHDLFKKICEEIEEWNESHFSSSSRFEINFSSQAREKFEKVRKELTAHKNNHASTLSDELLKQVSDFAHSVNLELILNINDTYSRFILTPEYKALSSIAVHLNYRAHDSTIFENRKTRRLLLNLNTMAAKKAINLGAIEQARTFVNIARELLLCENTNIWEEDSFLYNIAFDLLIAQGNCEYSSNIDSAISIFNSAIERSKTKHHLYQACYHAQMAYVSLGQFEKVFEILQSHIFPSKDELKFLTFQTDVEQLKLFMKTKMDYLKNTLLNRFTSKQDIMNLPDLNDLEKINFINILAMSSPGVYCMQSANSNYIYMIIILVCSEIILQHGLCEYAPFVLCALGWFWCTFELYPHMHIFVEGGVELARTKYKNQKHLAACLLLRLLSFFILPVNSLEVWNMAEEAFLVTMKSNNKDIGVFTIGQYTYHHFFDANGDMKTAISLSNKVIETLKHMGNFGLADTALAQLEMKQVLCGEHERFEPPYLTDVFSQPFYSYYHFMFKGISLYFQRSVEEAFQCFEKTYELRYNTAGLNNEWLNALFNGLTACEYETYLLKSATAPSLVDRCDKLIEYSLQTIEKVSHTNPLIFQCWHQLLLAERLLVDFRRFGTKNTATIISTYNRCLKLAIQERNLLIQKLAYWKIGVLYHELEMDDSVSGRYFSHAYAQFNEMGIIIFADYLWTNYRQQIEAYEKSLYENQLELSKQPSSNISSQDSFIDLSKPHCLLSPYNKSVIEENSDLDLKEIFTSILPLIREHTEAKRCCLMLKRNSILYLDAELTTNKQDSIDVENTNISPIMTIYEGRAIDSTLELPIPVTMAYRTLRTKTEQLYPKEDKTEPYFEKNQKTIFSALCVPVIRERSSIGCIYLENSENASGFSVENVTMANLIISVSIDNATIFSSINNSFTRFLPSEFLKMIGKTHVTKVQPGDAVTKEMTILFADIFGFTEIIEQLLPKEGFHFVNRLLLELAPPVSKHEGFIYRYLGDAIMALFPDPNSAVMAALEIISNLEKFNKNNICNIKIGVGISNGTVNIGTVGYEDRIDATIISDTTYIAAACESLTRVFNTQIIVTESVIPFISSTATNDHVHLTLLGQFILPHHNSKARNLYDVKKKSSKTEESWLKERSELTQVLDLFRERNFRECFSAATQLIKQSQNKCMVSICRKYMEACERYADHQLPEDWCGEIRLGREGEIKPYPFSV
ncbi:hypothetical protein C9374_005335 [Naegleria lovaniensis]|uniref:Guanylate cyclase domain-containing protein n=1 Tax=Naegleria lovaniensis TaxID=51637 RepID=A0AA88GRH0_NAELO|nr:uncharacterized protein C9374_005335 [Naegleria lovaniensis]KAG2382755.1 hypothetical protein C9374_005335 [Naegleria lovaniensis]